MKRRPPKKPAKLAMWKYRLESGSKWKEARARELYGTQGAASAVRHIDPKTGLVIAQPEQAAAS